MEIYIALLLIISINTFMALFCKNKQIRGLLIFLSFLLMFVLSAIRKDIGVDYVGHFDIFLRVANENEHYYLNEILYILLNQVAYQTGLGFEFVVASMTALTLGPIYYISKKEDNPLFLYLFFLIYYFPSFALIRQCGAISFAILGTYFFAQEHRIKKGIGFVTIGCLFHSSLWAYLPILLISHYIKLNVRLILAFTFVFCAAIFTFGNEVFLNWFKSVFQDMKYIGYLSSIHNEPRQFNNGMGEVLRLVFFFTILAFGNLHICDNLKKRTFNLGFSLLLITEFISLQSIIFSRVVLMFMSVLLIPFFNRLITKGKLKQVLSIWLFIIGILGYLIIFNYVGDITGWGNLPYKTIF